MTNHTAKCGLCDYEVTENGRYKVRSKIEEHSRTVHPERYKEVQQKKEELQKKIWALGSFGDLTRILWTIEQTRKDEPL